MGGSVIWSSCFIALLLRSCLLIPPTSAKKTNLLHMKHHQKPPSYSTHSDWYTDRLQSLTSSSHPDSIVYAYTTGYHGFAASLEPEEADSLRLSDEVLGVYEDTVYQLHTTRSPEFLGLNSELGLWAGHTPQAPNQASQDVIIGVLDTGAWPESKSFSDEGPPDIPSRWRGQCESAVDFNPKVHCNKKPIGARFFSRGYHVAAEVNVKPSPVLAAFSSRGPQMIGPGVNILAAWSEAIGPSGFETVTRMTQFNIMSGNHKRRLQ